MALIFSFLARPQSRRNLQILGRMLIVFVALVTLYSTLFHYLMGLEGRQYSWATGVYWTMVMMSTLGLGDITFQSDIGRVFSVVVLLSGTVFMLVLLPFMFIQFFYAPWLEAQAEARAPRALPPDVQEHVVLTGLGPVETALIRLLEQFRHSYVLIVSELPEALQLYDEGYRVMLGTLDDPETYRHARIEHAALVATTRTDTANTNVAFTVREISETVPIVASASSAPSVDILELAGCNYVLQLGEMLGQSLARRILGRDAMSHVIGEMGELFIAEAAAANTPLVGRTLREIRLRDHANVNVVGVWDRGHFEVAGPETLIRPTSVLVLAGSREQLDSYNALFCIYTSTDAPVVIIGGGRVGRATGRALAAQGVDYRIVERLPERIRDPEKYVLGDAAELEVLHKAGILAAPSVVITTHDDDTNVYLTVYCRRLRPDIQILGRSTVERNISTLHRAGADFVLSYASMGASLIFNLLQRSETLLLAEGLHVFQIAVPATMAGHSLADLEIRRETGCNVIAVAREGELEITPDANRPLPPHGELFVIGDVESEERFLKRYAAG